MSNEKKPGCLGVKGIMLRSYVGIIRIPLKQPGFNGMSCRFSSFLLKHPGKCVVHGAIPGFVTAQAVPKVVEEQKETEEVSAQPEPKVVEEQKEIKQDAEEKREEVPNQSHEEHRVNDAITPKVDPVFFKKDGFAVTPGDLTAKRTVIFNRLEDHIFAITVSPGTTVATLRQVEGLQDKDVEVITVMGNTLKDDDMVDHWQCIIIQKSSQRMNHSNSETFQVELSKMPRYQSILLQGGRVAYEEFAYYTSSFIAAEQARVVSPIIVLDLKDVALLVESWMHEVRENGIDLPVATAIITSDHWVPFLFRFQNGKWVGKSSPEGCCLWDLFGVDQVEMQLGQEVGKCFAYDCGFQTFAWLLSEVLCTEQHCIPIDQAALWRFLFWQHQLVSQSNVVESAIVILGGHPDEVVTAVAALLKEHGVFNDRVIARTNEAIEVLGRQAVIQAIQGTRPWVAIKQLANQKTPQFKLVREDEFQAVLHSRAKSGKPVGHKRQQKEVAVQNVNIQPDDLQVPPGVFIQQDGSLIHQISVSQIGAVGQGLVVCTEKEVQPFLDTSKLSEVGLAFAVVNPSSSFVQEYGQPIRFPANCRQTNEPVLVSAVIIQRGSQQVGRALPEHPMQIQEVPVETAKVLVYRDQIEGEWPAFCESPIKYVLQQVQCLASCKKANCGCKSWHPATDPDKEPLLDVWNRDFLTGAFRKTKAGEAIIFACAVRVRADVFSQVLTASGNGGVYLEPRTDDGKGHSPKFHTVWLNKMSYEEAIAAKATAKCSAYLIRVNRRYGLKTTVEQAEALHSQYRAEVPMLVEGKREVYQVGPLPWGTTRSSLQKLFEQWAWSARPLQPVGRSADGKGLMWLAQATSQPGATAVAMAHGDVIIVKKGIEQVNTPKVPAVEASSFTKKSLSSVEVPLQDPWADAATKLPHMQRGEIGLTAQQVAQIEANLEKKLHENKGLSSDEDVNMGSSLEPRVKQLETQIAQIVDAQKSQQTQTSNLSTQVQGLQCQVERQSKEFQSHLDNKMESQMAKIEALLSKRMRQE